MPRLPDRIIDLLKENEFDLPEKIFFSSPNRLLGIKGIGPKTLDLIAREYPMFLLSSLKKQTEILQIPLHVLTANKTGKMWSTDEWSASHRPERFVLEYYRSLGWTGDDKEEYALRLITLAACQGYINTKTRQSVEPHNYMFFDKYLWLACGLGSAAELVEPSVAITETELRNNLQLITEHHRFLGTYEDSIRDIDFLVKYWKNLGLSRFKKLLEMQISERGGAKYYTGWPDVTLIRGDEIKLVEVKTSDRIHESQMETIRELIIPLQIPVEIVQLKCSRGKKKSQS